MIRLSVPPGGASTINLGSGVASSSPGMVQTPTSATAHAAPVSAPAPAAEEQLAAAVATADVHAAPALEVLKLQVRTSGALVCYPGTTDHVLTKV